MKTPRITHAVGHIDDDLIDGAANASKTVKKKSWIKWTSAVAACLVVIFMATFFIQYIPTEYNLNYSYEGDNGEETYIASKSVWIYYVDNGKIERERVKLPCTAQNVFITWKHLNNIADDVKLLDCKIISNGSESTSEFEGEGVVNYEQGDYFILNITVTANLQSHKNYDELVKSLEKSMTEYSNIDFDEVNVIFK